jgi:hypothetical protein
MAVAGTNSSPMSRACAASTAETASGARSPSASTIAA